MRGWHKLSTLARAVQLRPFMHQLELASVGAAARAKHDRAGIGRAAANQMPGNVTKQRAVERLVCVINAYDMGSPASQARIRLAQPEKLTAKRAPRCKAAARNTLEAGRLL